MKVTDAKYTRRFKTGEFEFEEYTLVASIDDGDKVSDTIQQLKQDVTNCHLGVAGSDEAEILPEVKLDAKPEKKEKKAAKKKEKVVEEAPEETEDDADEVTSDDEEVSDDAEETSDDSEDVEDDASEDDAPEEKPAAKKPEAGKKTFKKKPQVYNRDSEPHKEIFSKTLRTVAPDWKKSDMGKAKAKNASVKMKGKDFLDEKGEVLESFKTELKKLMASPKK